MAWSSDLFGAGWGSWFPRSQKRDLGHPWCCGGLACIRTTAEWGSWFPRSQNRDMGHPLFVVSLRWKSNCKNNRRSFDSAQGQVAQEDRFGGGLRILLSHPCDNKKSQGWGTEGLWHFSLRKIRS